MPQEKNTIDPKVYIGGNWSGGAFVDASGLDPFRKMWQDPLGLESLLTLYYNLIAKFNFKPSLKMEPIHDPTKDITRYSPGTEPEVVHFLDLTAVNNISYLTPEQIQLFKEFLLVAVLLSPEIRGSFVNSEGVTEETNLQGIFRSGLANMPSSTAMYCGNTIELGNTYAQVSRANDEFLWGLSSSGEALIPWNSDPFLVPKFWTGPAFGSNMENVQYLFLHEFFHIASSAYDDDRVLSPDLHAPAFIWW